MYKLGDIVYFDKIKFKDESYDKKINRPCMVISSYQSLNGDELIFCMPLTSQIKSLNRNPDNYLIIPEIVYNTKKLSLLKINNLFVRNIDDANDTGLTVTLPKQHLDKLRRKISDYAKNEIKYYSLLEKILICDDIILDRQNKEESKKKKLERTLKR